jgi:chemotaxis protein methyltransferase CheR
VVAITSLDIAGFADLIEETCGVHYRPDDRTILASKVEAHALSRGHANVRAYYERLRYHDPGGRELHALLEAILVHETYFFREVAPLVEVVDGHLDAIIRKRGRARVWSAGCATGEEPLTLAMLLDDRGLLDKVQLIASDVSTTAIARAATGQYGSRALRDGHPRALADRYLQPSGNTVTVAPRIHASVAFETINLLDETNVRRLGVFDVILCRNVLMYFRENKVAEVVSRLARALEPEGVIAVGVAESLLRFGPSLVCEERGGSFFYRSA